MGKRALVLGGSGFLGSSIVKKLHSEGWEVFSLGRRQDNPTECAQYFQMDRNVPGALSELARNYRFQLVVDCAAYYREDAVGAVEAFAGLVEHYIFISTDYVYAFDPQAAYPLSEDARKQSDTPYGKEKLQCEAVLTNAWQQRGFPVTILRPPHILGAGKRLGADVSHGRYPELLDHIKAGKEITLIAEGSLLIQPVWNREIADGVNHIAQMESSFGQIFNFTGGQCITMVRYYEIIADLLGVPLRFESIGLQDFVTRNPDKVHYARHKIYNLSHLAALTNYTPNYRVEDAIQETLAWMNSGE